MKTLNIPEYAKQYQFIVCRDVENTLWFWGAFSDVLKAQKVAIEIGGVIICNNRN